MAVTTVVYSTSKSYISVVELSQMQPGEKVESMHIAKAIGYRNLDRGWLGREGDISLVNPMVFALAKFFVAKFFA